MSVLHTRDIAAEKPSALLEVALGEVSCGTQRQEPFADSHGRFLHIAMAVLVAFRGWRANDTPLANGFPHNSGSPTVCPMGRIDRIHFGDALASPRLECRG